MVDLRSHAQILLQLDTRSHRRSLAHRPRRLKLRQDLLLVELEEACLVRADLVDMRVVVACIEFLAAGLHPDDAAKQAIELLSQRVKGESGCIILDKNGQVGWAHNSSDMPAR